MADCSTGMVRARVRAAMRWQQVATVLVLCASTASAQPAEPAEPPAPDPAPVESDPTPDPVPKEPPAPQPPKPAPEPAPAVSSPDPTAKHRRLHSGDDGFRFGSYGRIIAGSDLRGGKPEKVKIVNIGPRIVEDSYLELDFSYGFERQLDGSGSYIVMRPVVTIAFDGTLFHDTGEFDAQPALRNVYLDARVSRGLTLWAGSRMYRGDDIYLFDYWPLDDQNTVGAGARFSQQVFTRDGDEPGEQTHDEIDLAAHVGFNRLNHPFQFQEIAVPDPVQGATIVEQLNRQRIVGSATATYTMLPRGAGLGAKLKVHSELHALGSGTREREDGTLESLPSDRGFLIGAQAGVFGLASPESKFRRHLNLFARYSQGLAAFDELAPPTSFGRGLQTDAAKELSFGLSGNYDFQFGQLMLGALSRRFVDADESPIDADDGWEYAIGARPLARIVPDFFVGGDISYQARFPRGINPITLRAEDPALLQIAPMIVYSPMGPSAYDRPQLRLVYRAARLNEGARNLYVPDDPRHDREWVHFLGVQAEWWFNSSRYR